MPAPLVTIVIPCRDQAHYLASALDSVSAQQHPRVEAIVVDDGSRDDTAAVALAGGAVLLRQPPSGLSAARNAGLAATDAPYVLFLDADDELLPDAVSSGVAALERHPEATMVARCCRLIDAAGRDLPTRCPPPVEGDLYGEWLVRNLAWTPGAVLFRRAALAEIGGFPLDVGPAADYAVYLTLARTTRVLFEPRAVVRYRQHATNMSRDHARMLKATLAVLRRERAHVPPAYRRRYREGLRAWRTFYGEEIIQMLRARARSRRLGRADLAAAGLLARECGPLLATHALRKLGRLVRGLPPSDIEPGRFGPSALPGPQSPGAP